MTTAQRRRATKPQRDPNAPLRVVVVTRLSKEKDDQVPHETQEAGCRKKVVAMGATVVAVFRDDISGDRLDRPGLGRALDLIRGGGAG